MKKLILAGCDENEIGGFVSRNGQPAFRTSQLVDWVFKKRVLCPDEMKNLPIEFRKQIDEEFTCLSASLLNTETAPDSTVKLLIALADGEKIESVIIPALDGRRTFCLSTQAGCPVQCRFCASGLGGLKRNLAAGEIMEQFFLTCDELGSLPDNIVFTGISFLLSSSSAA